MVIFDTIRIIIVKKYKHSQYSHPFIYEHNKRMLRLVSFTNTVARLKNELDKTDLFDKLKKTMHS